jgi:hypothetical protein
MQLGLTFVPVHFNSQAHHCANPVDPFEPPGPLLAQRPSPWPLERQRAQREGLHAPGVQEGLGGGDVGPEVGPGPEVGVIPGGRVGPGAEVQEVP